MKITLRQLLYFDALASELHFARAAERVAVTQPAMSAQIRELENLIGGTLVDRSSKGLALTPLGRAVAARTKTVLDGAAGIEALGATGPAADVPIRLGMIPTLAPYLVPDFLALTGEHGQALAISEGLTARLLANVRAGDLDGAVIALPSGDDSLADIKLFDDRFLLALPNAEARPGAILPAHPEEIDSSRLLLLDDGHCLADQVLSACKLRRESVSLALGATSLATVSRLVASGQGITLIPEIAAGIEGRGLRLARFQAPEPGRTIGLVTRRGAAGSAWTCMLGDLLKAARLRVPGANGARRRRSRAATTGRRPQAASRSEA